jgi:hypothetical protein
MAPVLSAGSLEALSGTFTGEGGRDGEYCLAAASMLLRQLTATHVRPKVEWLAVLYGCVALGR